MRILSFTSRLVPVKLRRPYEIAYRKIDSVELVFLKVLTNKKIFGLGCASPASFVTGESPRACFEALSSENLSWLKGQDLREFPRLLRQVAEKLKGRPAAAAALDMALHDCYAKMLKLPLVKVLGEAHQRIPTSVTIGICSPEETLKQAEGFLSCGFKVLKVKIGKSLEEDVERLSLLRKSFGREVKIRVDANQGYSFEETERLLEKASELELELVEQPLPVGKETQLLRLEPEARQKIAFDESLRTDLDALRFLVPEPLCGIFNIKLMKCGGVWVAKRIAQVAELAGISLMWGCMDESVVSISAALHAALSSPATRYLDLDGSFDLSEDPASGGFVLEDGFLLPLDRPGLGVELKQDIF